MNIHQEIPIIPGRGLVTEASTKMRLEYLLENDLCVTEISKSNLNLKGIQNNIESFIGSIEMPLGIVGPLVFKEDSHVDLVFTALGTLEGALVASMNRGAKAISQSGGFSAVFNWQKMVRAPLFLFRTKANALVFKKYVAENFKRIKNVAEKYSNHAKLIEINQIVIDNAIHAKFIYQTGDASGQNMTTTCTWHAMLYLVREFQIETGVEIQDYLLEGNGSSDKKVSRGNIINGRGSSVEAECYLPEAVIRKTLRTSSSQMIRAYEASLKMAKQDGMVGYNINVANAIAGIFVATGQDLASIHESSIGVLSLSQKEDGLLVKLSLPNLVIGTVGGGTHLAKQSEALQLMGCSGSGKVQRFAKLIAGFALGLELSTFAAIVSGEFAKAHEKLGRNKPVDWLVRSELNESFLKNCLIVDSQSVHSISLIDNQIVENGILTHIASRSSRKVLGFETVQLMQNVDSRLEEKKLLLKSKATGEEVIKGLHLIAASIDPELSNLIYECENFLEYKNCHLKELEVYEFLHSSGLQCFPAYFGKCVNESRGIHILIVEYIEASEMQLMNSENSPELWDEAAIKNGISTANEFHNQFREVLNSGDSLPNSRQNFCPWNSNELYNKIIYLLIQEEVDSARRESLFQLIDATLVLEKMAEEISITKTIVHNDFNSRNIALRPNGDVLVYDWELAILGIPHRDVVELLSFTLNESFSEDELWMYLEYHFKTAENHNLTLNDWYRGYYYSTLELIVTRLVFYEVAGIVVKYEFSERVLNTALKMLSLLKRYA